ncbi:hypothetical protein [Spiroplasma sp. AdecLV25b]|uniref:hypothetical protein n=1 Tax=Spiroplasma sp. AdecLV25b TaxID=3027162 RepID=UPI0027E14342|nr:hypothetical protein [Spiroplasma sp. AdecLV25b]
MKSLLNILAITIISTNLTTCSFNTPQTTFNNSHQPNLGVTNGTDVKTGDYTWHGAVKTQTAPDTAIGAGGGVLIQKIITNE